MTHNFDASNINIHNAEVQAFTLPEFSTRNVTTDILRLDKIHPVISGNKWFKLHGFLQEATEKKYDTILTFGGAWSNHIVATAYFAKRKGLRAIGVIRGERPMQLSNTLEAAVGYGMRLEFISRSMYSSKDDESFKTILLEKYGGTYIIPGGGAGHQGVDGSKKILSLVELGKYSHIICCMGTGTMFQGLVHSSMPGQEVIGIPVLKGITYPFMQSTAKPGKVNLYKIIQGYHFGGYAKKNAELIHFMNRFYLQTGIPTDFVYTGKLLFACTDLAIKDYFPAGNAILIIHSGGLQGNASLEDGVLLF